MSSTDDTAWASLMYEHGFEERKQQTSDSKMVHNSGKVVLAVTKDFYMQEVSTCRKIMAVIMSARVF